MVRTRPDGKLPTKHPSPIIMQVLKLENVDPGPKARFTYRPWRYCTKWELPTGILSVLISYMG